MTLRTILAFILMLTSVAALILQSDWMKVPAFKITSKVSLPDAYVNQLHLVQMNDQGLPDVGLHSPLVEHYPEENHLVFIKPQATVYQTDQPAWEISSERGEALQDLEIFRLEGQVVAHQPVDENHPETFLRTEKVQFYRSTRQLESDQKVSLDQAGSHLESIGVKADLKAEEVTLLSQAQGYYDGK